jgi:hypothetical protein
VIGYSAFLSLRHDLILRSTLPLGGGKFPVTHLPPPREGLERLRTKMGNVSGYFVESRALTT